MLCCISSFVAGLFTWCGLGVVLGLGLLALVGLVAWAYIFSRPYPSIEIEPRERVYLDPHTNEAHPLPQLGTILQSKPKITYADLAPSSVHLSVVVPAYNEEQRLPSMLNEAIEYLEGRRFKYEIIIVDDGSTDRTTEVALDYVQAVGSEKVRVIKLVRNRGKGGAVRIGMLAARGELLMFADADGASNFGDMGKLEKYIYDHLGTKALPKLPTDQPFDPSRFPIAIGSRSHLEKDSIAKRSLARTILMKGFHFVVWLLTVRKVSDTQCGFKLFPRSIAHVLFTHLHVERWAFDVELLLLAEQLQLPIGEVAIRWQEIEGSKLVPVFSWLQMGLDVSLIGIRYAIGAFKYPRPPFAIIPSLSSSSSSSSKSKPGNSSVKQD